MSHDQAARLRSLALRTARTIPTSTAAAARTIVVSSGERRLGGTTLAVHLAIGMARQGQRVVLVDTDLETAGASRLCGVSLSPSLTDVLVGRRSIHEVLQRGPAGIQVVAGSQSVNDRALLTERAAERLMKQLAGLGRHTDLVILDVPCREAEQPAEERPGAGPLVTFWQQANDMLLVTTGDDSAVMNSYALLKSLWSRTVVLPRLHVVVNHAEGLAAASDVHARLDRSSRRFLQLPLTLAGAVPTSPAAARTATILADPLDIAVEQIAQRLLSDTGSEEVRTVA